MRFTLDTNILVYAADHDAGERHLASVALVRRAKAAGAILTLQSLGELSRWLLTRGRMPAAQVAQVLTGFRSGFRTVAADEGCLEAAVRLVGEHHFSFWDAMLFATARQAGCALLISEDGHDGLAVDGLTIANPFAASPSPLIEQALAG